MPNESNTQYQNKTFGATQYHCIEFILFGIQGTVQQVCSLCWPNLHIIRSIIYNISNFFSCTINPYLILSLNISKSLVSDQEIHASNFPATHMEPSKVLFQHMDWLGRVGNKMNWFQKGWGSQWVYSVYEIRKIFHVANRVSWTISQVTRTKVHSSNTVGCRNFHHEIMKLCSTRKPKGFWHSCLHRSSPSHLNLLQSY